MIVFNKILFGVLFCSLFYSCSKSEISENSSNYEVPTTYNFERNGSTTIDYTGQTVRILMLEEMGNYVRDRAAAGSLVDAAKLTSMYANTDQAFSTTFLNNSGKALRDKTAASKDYFTLNFGGGTAAEQDVLHAFYESTFMAAQLASTGSVASAGVAGNYLDGTSVRLFAANGLEPQQMFLKGLMGAVLLDQVVNHYLSSYKLDEGLNRQNNTDKMLVPGKNYTTMEHNWDEAFGYIYGGDSSLDALKFWSSYISQVNSDSDFNTISSEISLAFRKGRAAILANDYETRNAQIAIIKSKLALVLAVRTVHYLQEGKEKLNIDGGAKALHALSEAYGFILCLRFTNEPGTNSPYFSKLEVETMIETLMNGANGIWQPDPVILDDLSEQIALRFEFTVQQAGP
jgi:hypothetical protein